MNISNGGFAVNWQTYNPSVNIQFGPPERFLLEPIMTVTSYTNYSLAVLLFDGKGSIFVEKLLFLKVTI